MSALGILLVTLATGLSLYAYVGYPVLLAVVAKFPRGWKLPPSSAEEWPLVSVSLPAYNGEATIGGALEALLAVDYPRERLQLLVVSDASTDRTDEIVASFADRGVELLRLQERAGKTAAENAAIPRLRGDIVVNTDASIRILPDSLKPLVASFRDPSVGVASGWDISAAASTASMNVGEGSYVGYEMWVRKLETRLGGIVGASGCFYAIRAELHRTPLPAALSRDFASALVARERGFRAVSVDEATCIVPRTESLGREYRRKVRTMARGLDTLWYKRALMNPLRYGFFSWKLMSHKLCRWLVPPAMFLALVGLTLVANDWLPARLALLLTLLGGGVAIFGLRWRGRGDPPRFFALAGYVLVSALAGFMAWQHVLAGQRSATWEPTLRRTDVGSD